MKKLLLTLTLLFTLGLSIQGVAAQVDAPEIETASIGEVEGLESAYGRAYTVDIEAMMEDPDFDMASMDTSAMMNNVGIQGFTFDSEDNAKKYIEDSKSQIEESKDSEITEGMEITVSDLEDLDKDGYYIEMSMGGDIEVNSAMVIFVDGNTVFQVTSMAETMEDSKAQAYDVANFVLDAEVETEEVTLNADGSSTGGVFDRMPVAGDEVIGEMVPSMDMDLFNPTGE